MPRPKSVDRIFEDAAERYEVCRNMIMMLADQHIVIEATEEPTAGSVGILIGLEMAMARIVMLSKVEPTNQDRVNELVVSIHELFENDDFRAEVVKGIESKDYNSMGYMTGISTKILGLGARVSGNVTP
jgi:hypothetical protein